MGRRTIRVDDLLVARGLADTRDEAQRAIIAGEVSLGNRKAKTGGELVPLDTPVHMPVKGRFVSRGGEKLAGALDAFSFDPSGLNCIDIGASTGGFTDCLLKAGAAAVTAVDVGYGQLAWSVRSDERVVVMERTNIRYVTREQVPDPIELASLDVSFISLRLVLPTVKELLSPAGEIVCLIKPQFEAGKEKVGKKGVVRELETHKEVLRAFRENAASLGLTLTGLTFSPIKGPEGNIEYLGHLIQGGEAPELDTDAVAEASHEALKGESGK